MLLAALLTLAAPLTAVDLAHQVEIIRDEWGVPHIYGKTDASVVYAQVIAMGEDNFAQLEEDVAIMLGRAAEIRGEEGLVNDLAFRAYECELKGKQAYERAEPPLKRIAEAYAAGLEAAFKGRSKVFSKIEPWAMFAIEFRGDNNRGILSVAKQTAGPAPSRQPLADKEAGLVLQESGSNAWAIAPSRTASGKGILFSNPHVGFFGGGQRYEVHLESEEGWRFSGFTILAQPIPHAGHNGYLGWSHTNTGVDTTDQYLESFDVPSRPLAYRYDGGYRDAVRWRDKLQVLVDGKLHEREYEFLKTHHGPIVDRSGDNLVAVRNARAESGGFWRQKYAMGRARSLDEFKKAMEQRAMTGSNTTYADKAGNIAFWYGNCIPKRDDQFDWAKPVDGSDKRTEWQGYHELSEIPQVLNPTAGWLQNCNSSFATTTVTGNPSVYQFPKYMNRDPDSTRAKNSRRILASQEKFTFEQLERLAWDTYVYTAASRVPQILAAVKDESLKEPLEALGAWDFRSSVDSAPMTLYVLTEVMASNGQQRLRELAPAPALAEAFRQAVKGLEERYGTWRVEWGRLNRLQRPDTFGRLGFDSSKASLPIPGAAGGTGIIYAFYPRASADPFGPQFGIMGNTYVSLVEFGNTPRHRSLVTFGQSGDPGSRHFFDQAPLFAAGKFKNAWWTKDDVLRHAKRRYRPGG